MNKPADCIVRHYRLSFDEDGAVVRRRLEEADVVHFAGMSDEERIRRLENRVAETRKMLLGALLLAREMWGKELSGKAEGRDILRSMEEAEEAFAEAAQPERFTMFEHSIDVIHRRAETFFELMSYMSQNRKT